MTGLLAERNVWDGLRDVLPSVPRISTKDLGLDALEETKGDPEPLSNSAGGENQHQTAPREQEPCVQGADF